MSMTLKVQTLSIETIKPSFPTPPHLHFLPLSSFDQQYSPQIYTHTLLFFSTTTTTTSSPQQQQHLLLPLKLKTSLSHTLQHFYPLAGKLTLSPSNNTLQIHCNDDGINFIHSRTDTSLPSFLLLNDPSPIHRFPDLLPIKASNFRWADKDPLLAVQLTTFDSSGFSLGISISHMVSDLTSLSLFLNSWAGLARTGTHGPTPRFDTALVFPPQRHLPVRPMPEKTPNSETNVNISIKRFIVSSHAVESLRKDSTDQSFRPTRVEAVSGFLWRCLKRVRRDACDLVMQVNLRRRMAELSELSFGNAYMSLTVTSTAGGSEERRIREVVRRVDEEYVRSTVEGEGVNLSSDNFFPGEKGRSWVVFSSWCRLGLYGCDFGWGKPVWVACGIRDMQDVCIMVDGSDGEGMEIWLWLEEGEMEKVEGDEEFVKFVSS